jgi:hypothetical protein
MRTIKRWHTVRVIAACFLAVGCARVLIAACQEGCSEGNCYRLSGNCWAFEYTICPKGSDIWALNERGAVGGVCKTYQPITNITVYSATSCSRECAKDKSRALNSSGTSTCDGLTEATTEAKSWCDS